MSSDPNQTASTPPNLGELFQRYLRQQVGAHAEGLGIAEPAGDVTPYEAVPAQPIEPRLAWSETLFVLRQLAAAERSLSPVPEWPNLVAFHDPCFSLSFSTGNFPQRVRNLQPLLQAKRLSDLRGRDQQPIELEALLEWTRQTIQRKQFPQMLLSVGLLRMCRQFKAAQHVFEQQLAVPAEMTGAWENEHAALYWEQGESEKAIALWHKQASHAGVQFNIGMAALFTDRPADARSPLQAAVRQLPESSGWHHLARLYLALAEMRAE
jgi:tetratricopeptide (TPR) repeat protein